MIDWEAHEGEYVDPVLHPYRGKLWHFGSRKNSVQKVSVCEGPISTPSTSRRPVTAADRDDHWNRDNPPTP